MANFGPAGRSRHVGVPMPPTGRRIAVYETYLAAQRAVDFLSDRHFPVQHVTIVGTDLQMVERVTGRLTYGRVAMAGAASGAWFGLFVGLLLSLFARGNSLFPTVLPAILIGAGFGILFGVLSYALTGGRRDFTSTSQVVASQYALLCAPEQAADAERLLAELPGDRGARVEAPSSSFQAPPPQGQPHPAEPPTQEAPAPPTGPTYGEMIERQRRERLARERGEAVPPPDQDRGDQNRVDQDPVDQNRVDQDRVDDGADRDRPPGSAPS
ncbi:MAG: general stress protein [Actinomycetes bacterium]